MRITFQTTRHTLFTVYVMLCCYYICFAFTSIYICPALTQLLVKYVPHYSWLLSNALLV